METWVVWTLVGLAVLLTVTALVTLAIVWARRDGFAAAHAAPQAWAARVPELDALEFHLEDHGLVQPSPAPAGRGDRHVWVPAWVQRHAPALRFHPDERYFPVAVEDYWALGHVVDTATQRSFALTRPRKAHAAALADWFPTKLPADVRHMLSGTSRHLAAEHVVTERCPQPRLVLALSRSRIPVDTPSDAVGGHHAGSPLYPHPPRLYARVRQVTVDAQAWVDVHYTWVHALGVEPGLVPGQGQTLFQSVEVTLRFTWPPGAGPVRVCLPQGRRGRDGVWVDAALLGRAARTAAAPLALYVARASHRVYPTAGRWPRLWGLADDLTAEAGWTWTPRTTWVPEPYAWGDARLAERCGRCPGASWQPQGADTPAWWYFPGRYAAQLGSLAATHDLLTPLGATRLPAQVADAAAAWATGTPPTQRDLLVAPVGAVAACDAGTVTGPAAAGTAPWALVGRGGQDPAFDRVHWTSGLGLYLRGRLLASQAWWWARVGWPGGSVPVTWAGVTLVDADTAVPPAAYQVGTVDVRATGLEAPTARTLRLDAGPQTLRVTGTVTWSDGAPPSGWVLTLPLTAASVTLLARVPLRTAPGGEWYVDYKWKGTGPPALGRVPGLELARADEAPVTAAWDAAGAALTWTHPPGVAAAAAAWAAALAAQVPTWLARPAVQAHATAAAAAAVDAALARLQQADAAPGTS